MTRHYGQYPDIYSTDDTRYTFYYDSGERVTLIAGENGVTQEWIHALKLEHRSEYNMLRRGLRARDSDLPRMISLNQYMEEVGDEGRVFCDTASDVAENYIAAIEGSDKRERIRKALSALRPDQQELLIKATVYHVPLKDIAVSLGIKYQSVQSRLETARKIFLKNF